LLLIVVAKVLSFAARGMAPGEEAETPKKLDKSSDLRKDALKQTNKRDSMKKQFSSMN
jgi:hypothetical protein